MSFNLAHSDDGQIIGSLDDVNKDQEGSILIEESK